MSKLLPTCVCGYSGVAETRAIHGIPTEVCGWCGILRQQVEMTPEEYQSFYLNEYHCGVYLGDRDRHLHAAKARLQAYAVKAGETLLDVGCARGEFVEEALRLGVDACGQDISTTGNAPNFFGGTMYDSAFPCERFDVVTVHDVLEHMEKPVDELAEISRITKSGGRLIVDFPDFYSEQGIHHWRPTQHLWLLTEKEVIDTVSVHGFVHIKTTHPVPGKLTLYFQRDDREKGISVLSPAGIGDVYWCMTKFPGLRREYGRVILNVMRDTKGAARDRSGDFVNMSADAVFGEYRYYDTRSPEFHEIYMLNGRTMIPLKDRGEFMLGWNGVLRYGRKLSEVDERWGTEWFPRRFRSLPERRKRASMHSEYGDYLCAYVSKDGMFSRWIKEMPPSRIKGILTEVSKAEQMPVFLLGASWNVHDISSEIADGKHIFNLCGKTSLEECFGIISGSRAMFGFCSGLTIMSTVMRIPTVIVWNSYFREAFWANACPEPSYGKWYFPVSSGTASPQVVSMIRRALHG